MNNYLKKQAKFSLGDALGLLNPLDTMIGGHRGTPMQLAADPQVNRAIWNTLFSGGALLAAGAGLRYLSSKEQDKEFSKKQREAVDAKLNGIVPVTEPDSDLDDTKKREKRREQEITKEASGFIENALLSAVPIAAAGGAMYAGAAYMGNKKEKEREKKLKEEIAQLQNKLDSLYSERLALREQRRGIQKQADDVSWWHKIGRLIGKHYGDDNEQSIFSRFGGLPITTAAIASLLAGYGAYQYFSKRDKDRAKVKMLKERILPSDLVGTPPTIVMELGKDGKVRVPGRGSVDVKALPAPAAPVSDAANDATLHALGLNM